MRKRVYTDEMVEFLSANLNNYSWAELTKLFNKNFSCKKNEKNIMRLCSRNELRKHHSPKDKNKYTTAMVDFLCSNVDKYSWENLTKLFNQTFNYNKSVSAIKLVYSRLPVIKQQSLTKGRRTCKKRIENKRALTEEMVDFLWANSSCISDEELTKLFNSKFGLDKRVYHIRHYCAKNGIKRFRGLPEEMLDFLRANFEDVSHEELTKRFNSRFNLKKKTYDLKNYCTKYGLRKSDPYKAHPLRLPVGYESRRTGMGGVDLCKSR